MKVAVTGATGFIGRHLAAELIAAGHGVLALTRDKERALRLLPPAASTVQWGADGGAWEEAVSECDAVVNLAGENLSSGRWTAEKKRLLLDSRLGAIRAVTRTLDRRKGRETALIQASAIGYYGSRGGETLSEEAASGSGYLARIARDCEGEASAGGGPTLRVVMIRSGIVLARDGGMLPQLFGPLLLGFGGFPGDGSQWLSWIHVDDEVAAIRFLLEHRGLSGPFNLTAPEPLPMRELVKLGGEILHRPVWMPLPRVLLRVAFGEMADEALLAGQRVLPARLKAAGFTFRYPNPREALEALYCGSRS